jgi:hypothetical protein
LLSFQELWSGETMSKLHTSETCKDQLIILVTRQSSCMVAWWLCTHTCTSARMIVKPRPPLARPSVCNYTRNEAGDSISRYTLSLSFDSTIRCVAKTYSLPTFASRRDATKLQPQIVPHVILLSRNNAQSQDRSSFHMQKMCQSRNTLVWS